MMRRLTSTFAWLNRDIALLIVTRILRSILVSYLLIVVPIYIAKIGFNAIHFSYLVGAASLSNGLLAAVVGFCSDRFGRRNLLIIIALMQTAGCLAFALSTNFAVLMAAAFVGGLSGGGPAGGGGAFGPSFPAEQALIAEHSLDLSRTTVFGAMAFLGVAASGLGALMAALPHLLQHLSGMELVAGFRALFWLGAVLAAGSALAVVPVSERRTHAAAVQPLSAIAALERQRFGLSRSAWGIVGRFAVVGAINGLAFGMLGPFVVLWFYRRFGATAADLAGLYFIINLVAMLPYLTVGHISRRAGAVNTVTLGSAVAGIMLVLMALMPVYWMAALLYVVRATFNALQMPVRQSYMMGLIDSRERATVAGLSSAPSQLASLLSPYLAGILMENFWVSLPIEIAAVLAEISTVLFYCLFRRIKPPEERTAPVSAAAAPEAPSPAPRSASLS
jgi:MFS family permease